MEENKELQEENLNTTEQETQQTEENVAENVTKEPTTEELLAEEKDRYIRLYAEFENYKKRTLKEKMEFAQYANTEMMISMLAVLDDFERAIKEIAKNGNEADLKGIELIYQKFKNKLIEKGLKPLEVNAGDDFNVDFHEAISYGVIKMNIDTDLQYAFMEGVRKYFDANAAYLQGQIGNPDGTESPNKKYYDPRGWIRKGEETFSTRLVQAFEDLNNVNTLK